MRNILVTGGCGFIGSNFITYFISKYKDYKIINLDLLTYAGNEENLKEVKDNPRYKFIKGNICNNELVEYVFKEFDITGVINFAAESHVDNSILNPILFIETNVLGTLNLLNNAYKHWMHKPFNYKKDYENKVRFHHISTDEVYGSLGSEGYFTEYNNYKPNSPYSASKASSDMIVRSYKHTYGIDTVITNCSNNYGFKQHDEKLIPTIIRNAINGNFIPIYGNGKNSRDWLFVLDHCKAIDKVFHEGKSGEIYNVGTKNDKENLYIANKICEILEEILPVSLNPNFKNKNKTYKDLITFVEDRPGHDFRYSIDYSKINKELGWKPEYSLEEGLKETVKWYVEKYKKTLK
jgi:dTDP-glucose 4,6-dehydratase